MDRERLRAELDSLIQHDEQAAETVLEYLRERDGGVGLLLRVLSRRPEQLVPHVVQGVHTYEAPRAIDPKTAELAAVSAAAALMCEHCLDSHMRSALGHGASMDEIYDVLLVAGSIAKTSTLSVAFRRFRTLEGAERPAE
jgi:AhpD family alkylhydroperoxidase